MKSSAAALLLRSGESILASALKPEARWAVTGQLLAAAGLLVGMRLQTEFIAPEVFGATVLMVAYGALCVGVVCTPYLQGALRFHPEMAAVGAGVALKRFIERTVLRRLLLALAVTLIGGAVYCAMFGASYWGVVLLCGLCAVDVGRSIELAFMNAARRQREYALWTLYEAWARPIAAVACVLASRAQAAVVLLGYLLASGASLAAFHLLRRLRGEAQRETTAVLDAETRSSLLRYARPLIPLGLVGWLGALSDRYVVAGLLGLRAAGIYAAVSGLIGRPNLMMQQTIELAVRPVYFAAVAGRDRAREAAVYARWLSVNAAAGLALLTGALVGSDLIVRVLLGPSYVDASLIIPFVALAQFFLIVSYTLNGYLYAHKRVGEVLLYTAVAALLTVTLVVLLGWHWGLRGVAIAGAVSNLLQVAALALTVRAAHRGGQR